MAAGRAETQEGCNLHGMCRVTLGATVWTEVLFLCGWLFLFIFQFKFFILRSPWMSLVSVTVMITKLLQCLLCSASAITRLWRFSWAKKMLNCFAWTLSMWSLLFHGFSKHLCPPLIMNMFIQKGPQRCWRPLCLGMQCFHGHEAGAGEKPLTKASCWWDRCWKHLSKLLAPLEGVLGSYLQNLL